MDILICQFAAIQIVKLTHQVVRDTTKQFVFYYYNAPSLRRSFNFHTILMSHWRSRATKGAEFWISCKRPAFLSNFSHLQLIQNSAPSVARWPQWSSPSVSTFFPISEFSYFLMRFFNHIFLPLIFPISLSDFTIWLLSKNLITK